MIQNKKTRTTNSILFVILFVVAVVVLYPLFFILNNSFKGKFFISKDPFSLPTGETFSGLSNYVNGLVKTGLLSAIGWSFFITIVSVLLIILFTSMTAYYITRVKTKLTQALYYMFVFSMVVPFQMVMFTMTSLADRFHLRNPLGMCILYLGFDAGLSVFMFAGFVKSIPLEIEEAARVDGANKLQVFGKVVLPIVAPGLVAVAIYTFINAWNEFLYSLILMNSSDKMTVAVALKSLEGQEVMDWGVMMAASAMVVIPSVIFFMLIHACVCGPQN